MRVAPEGGGAGLLQTVAVAYGCDTGGRGLLRIRVRRLPAALVSLRTSKGSRKGAVGTYIPLPFDSRIPLAFNAVIAFWRHGIPRDDIAPTLRSCRIISEQIEGGLGYASNILKKASMGAGEQCGLSLCLLICERMRLVTRVALISILFRCFFNPAKDLKVWPPARVGLPNSL